MPATVAYTVGMQYTLRDIPPEIDHQLRERAKTEGKSLNQVAIEALARGTGVAEERARYRTLRDLAGTMVQDPDFDAALADQDRVDEDLWK